jgi:hypothetical protein
MKQLLLITALFIWLPSGFGQGKVSESSSSAIKSMVAQYVEAQKATPAITGWRIQLLATTDRQEMESILYRFRVLYPYIQADWEHAKPYYKIKVGAFQSKLETYRILHLIKQDYPGAYPVIDNAIKPQEFLY